MNMNNPMQLWLKYLLPSVGTSLASCQITGFVPSGVVCDDHRGVMGAGKEFWKGIDYVGGKDGHTQKEGTKIHK